MRCQLIRISKDMEHNGSLYFSRSQNRATLSTPSSGLMMRPDHHNIVLSLSFVSAQSYLLHDRREPSGGRLASSGLNGVMRIHMAGLASDVELWHRFPGNHRDLLTGAGPRICGVANKSRTDRDVWLRPRNPRVANAECRMQTARLGILHDGSTDRISLPEAEIAQEAHSFRTRHPGRGPGCQQGEINSSMQPSGCITVWTSPTFSPSFPDK
jgi:hypothetical protein